MTFCSYWRTFIRAIAISVISVMGIISILMIAPAILIAALFASYGWLGIVMIFVALAVVYLVGLYNANKKTKGDSLFYTKLMSIKKKICPAAEIID